MRLPIFRRTTPREQKASRTGALVALFTEGRPRWTPRDYVQLAREGYQKNPVAYRCVRTIAEAVAGLPLVLMQGGRELDAHPLLDLLARPNPRQTGAELLEAVTGFLLVAGNAYVELVSLAGTPRELHALRPDRMKIVPGAEGWPQAYEYSVAGRSVRFDNSETPSPAGSRTPGPILHLALFHPTDDHYGFSPLEAAASALDVHNAAAAWNKALLDNAARPSGALVYTAGGGTLSEEQFERLKQELEHNFQGAANAGKPLLLEGGLDWRNLSLSPKDMDFVQAKHAAAREIALAFGVPPMLLGIPGDNTYSNYLEANRALYRQTVLPLAGRILDALAAWLAPAFGEGTTGEGQRLRLVPDLDQVSALAMERESLWSRVSAASFLTDDEKRAAVGYGPRESFGPREDIPDSIKAGFDPDQPRVPRGNSHGGQWTSGGGTAGPAADFDSNQRARNAGLNDPRVLLDADLPKDE
jgi:HK97 family phage portal protein